MDDVNVLDCLDSAFGDEPAHRPIGDRLSAGRRSLWRRRAAAGAGATALVAVVAGTSVAVVNPGEEPRGGIGVAAEPGPTTVLPDLPPVGEGQLGIPTDQLVVFGDTGALVPVSDAVTIVQQFANPDLPDSYDNVGEQLQTAVAEVLVGDQTWYVLARDPRQPDYIATPASIGGPTLAAFLDKARAQYAGGTGLL